MPARLHYSSILLMESHGLAPNVRSQSFASINVWSKLYQAGPYFLDLMLGPGESALALRGELLAETAPIPSEATVTLHDPDGAVVASTSARHGSFSFELDRAGSYLLELNTPHEQLTVADIEV